MHILFYIDEARRCVIDVFAPTIFLPNIYRLEFIVELPQQYCR